MGHSILASNSISLGRPLELALHTQARLRSTAVHFQLNFLAWTPRHQIPGFTTLHPPVLAYVTSKHPPRSEAYTELPLIRRPRPDD